MANAGPRPRAENASLELQPPHPPRSCWIPACAGTTAVRATQASPLLGYNRLRAMPFVVTPAKAGVHPRPGFPLEPACAGRAAKLDPEN